MREEVIKLLAKRGVMVQDIGEIVYQLQVRYYPTLQLEQCVESVLKVLSKREVQHALYTGIFIDEMAEEGRLPSPLQEIVASDLGLYGVDEIMALSITNVYGSIGLTNFGYVDKVKLGILTKLNSYCGQVHTFLDDLVAGIAAAAAARLAHNYTCADKLEMEPEEG